MGRIRSQNDFQQDRTIAVGLAETHDIETGFHIRRTQHYVRFLAERLRQSPRFQKLLTTENIALIYKTSALHDIGKVGIPDHILLKPGKLTEEEFERMKTHTTIGRDALMRAVRGLGTNTFLRFAKEIAYSHHEKWDGTGYPQGLKGDQIPAAARIMAVADVYDALTSGRVYKPTFPHARALSTMKELRGSHFDPDMIDTFLQCEDRFLNISHRLADGDGNRAAAPRHDE
jgi:cyclic di-GMP phosphodiesterase